MEEDNAGGYGYNANSSGTPDGKSAVFYKDSKTALGLTESRVGFGLAFSMSDGDYGRGGSVYCRGYRFAGASGGYMSTTVSVSPGTAYEVIVGAGGAGVISSFADSGHYANAGNSGFVMIEYGD